MSYGDFLMEMAISRERAQICEQLMQKEIGLVEGIRKIVALSQDYDAGNNKNVARLESICRQSAQFPIGEARKDWDAETLLESDRKRREFETEHWYYVHELCRQISERNRTVYGA